MGRALSFFLVFIFGPLVAYAQNLVPTQLIVNVGHTHGLYTAAISPDEKYLVSYAFDDTIRIWQISSGQLIRVISNVGNFLRSIVFGNSNYLFFVAPYNGNVRVYDIRTGDIVKQLRASNEIAGKLEVTRDGHYIAVGTNTGRLAILDAFTDAIVTEIATGDLVRDLSFLGGSQKIVFMNYDEKIKILNLNNKRLLKSIEYKGNDKSLTDVSLTQHLRRFDPDPHGRMIAIAAPGPSIRLIDAQSGLVKSVIGLPEGTNVTPTFSPRGDLLVAGYHKQHIILVELKSDENKVSEVLIGGELQDVFYSKDGARLYIINKLGELLQYSVESGTVKNLFVILETRSVGQLLFNEPLDPTVRQILLRRSSRAKVVIDKKGFEAAASIAVQAAKIDGRRVSTIPSADGSTIFLNGIDDPIRHSSRITAWDVATGKYLGSKIYNYNGFPNKPVSSGGNSIAIVNENGHAAEIWLWDARSDKTKVIAAIRMPKGWIAFTRLVFSPDGSSLAVGLESSIRDNEVQIFDVASEKLITVVRLPLNATPIALSSDKTTMILDEGASKTVFDLSRGSVVRSLEKSSSTPDTIWFSDDKKIVVALNPSAQIWDLATGRLLVSSFSFENGEWVSVTSEGFFDSTSGGARRLNVIRGLESYTIDQFYDALHRPDLVREKLAGDPQGKVREAAAKLDLTKVVASGSAPRVTIASPAAALAVTEAQVSIEASVADQGGGIGKVEWRVNGTTLGVEAAPSGSAQAGRAISLRKTLTLEPGQNRIEVVAYNAQGLIASDPAQVVVTLQGQQAKTAPRLYVLTVGVNDYWDSRLHLAFAVPDAQAIGDALSKGGKGLYERVEVTMALDGQATASQLDKTFTELSRKVRPQDVFVFFLSGHGKTVDGRFYFIPQDFKYTGEESIAAKGIGQDQLQEWLARIPARKSVLLFDACESGSLTEDQNKAVTRGMEEMTAVDRLTHAMGRTVLTATTDDKPAAEGLSGHGVFTYALLASLGEAQTDADGLIEVAEIASYVDRRVPELSYEAWKIRQVPQMKIVGSNFPLSHKVTMLPAGPNAPTAAIPKTSTHVVIAPVTVRQSANETAASVIQLTPGTQVRLMQTEGGWVLIARDGKKLGYVEAKALVTLQ